VSNVFIMECAFVKIKKILLLNLISFKIGLCSMYIYVYLKLLFKNLTNAFTVFLGLVTFWS
jgi:hypothetical protein